MRIGITGASGLIGSALRDHLVGHGHSVTPFVRRPAAGGEIQWDPANGVLDPDDLAELDAIVNLAGAGIGDRRWSPQYRREIRDSRVGGTTLLANAIAAAGGPGVLLSGSAIGFYGDTGDGDGAVDETAAAGSGFLADVCEEWEQATEAAEQIDVRVVHLRTGIVLSRHGGALSKMLPLFRFGVGGRFGNGRQWMSWITIDDEVRAIEHLLTSTARGPVNVVAPAPVRNREFARTLGQVLGRPAMLPAPSFGPKLLLGGERADALLFEGQQVAPAALAASGFRFEHPDLEAGLRAVLDRR